MDTGRPRATPSTGNPRSHRGRPHLLLLVLVIALWPALGQAEHVPTPVLLRVSVYYDDAYAQRYDVDAVVAERLAFSSDIFQRAGASLVLGELEPAPPLAPCGGAGSAIDWLMARTLSSDIAVYLSGSAPPSGAVLGCAIQDGIALGAPFAALHDPPYVGVTLGGTPWQREYHSNLLFAHEVGHILGGTHELAIPPDPSIPIGGTLMSPTLQYNVPSLSGAVDPRSGDCLSYGNVCRIREVLHASAPATMGHTARVVDDKATYR